MPILALPDTNILPDNERKLSWINLSHCLNNFNKELVLYVQGLGSIDFQLVEKEKDIKNYFRFNPVFTENNHVEYSKRMIQRGDNIILAHLWVLGCYEVIRTIHQLLRENEKFVNTAMCSIAKEVKIEFERIRIPLAKLEKPSRSNNSDYSIVLPGYTLKEGMVWQINDEEAIGRDYLAMIFLSLLREIDNYFKE